MNAHGQSETEIDLTFPQTVHILHRATRHLRRKLPKGVPHREEVGDGSPQRVIDPSGTAGPQAQELPPPSPTLFTAPHHDHRKSENQPVQKLTLDHQRPSRSSLAEESYGKR